MSKFPDLVHIPSYEDIEIVTQTVIVATNLVIKLDHLFHILECVPLYYPNYPKPKYMMVRKEESEHLCDGDLVFAEYKNETKGRRFTTGKKQYMLNTITVVMKIGDPPTRPHSPMPAILLPDQKENATCEEGIPVQEPWVSKSASGKYYSIKISNRGVFQFTGLKSFSPIRFAMQRLSEIVFRAQIPDQIERSKFTAYVVPAMVNVKFILPYHVDREELRDLVNAYTHHIALLENTAGYVGVNIKIQSQVQPLEEIPIVVYHGSCLEERTGVYLEYLQSLPDPEREKKREKHSRDRDTFLVFYSGSVIMPGTLSLENRKASYNSFVSLIRRFQDQIFHQCE